MDDSTLENLKSCRHPTTVGFQARKSSKGDLHLKWGRGNRVPRLSVVVPHISSEAALEQTLLSLLENRDRNCEVIVAHCGDYVDPYQLDSDEVTMVSLSGASCTGLINEGIACSVGSIIQVILPGTTVVNRWYADALEDFDDYQIGAMASAISCENISVPVLGLQTRQLPRHQWATMRDKNESVFPILNGGYWRRKLLSCLDGLLSCDSLMAAETELAAALQAMEVDVEIHDEVTLNCEQLTYSESGYSQGQQLAKIARGYASLEQSPVTIDSMPVRMGKLAASLLNPNSVSHRLGWTLGLQDCSLVSPIRSRIEQATQTWNSYLEECEYRSQSSHRRAA